MPSSFPLLLPIWAASVLAVQYKGVDWSSLLVEERDGVRYSSPDGTVKPLETIFADAGVNTVRQRIWVDPANGEYDLNYNLELAERAQAAGLELYLDFHYSDIWADPKHQDTPAAWAGLNADDLTWQLYNYTLESLNSFAAAGISVQTVSIGNEITPGLLFPTGQLGTTDGAYNVARLLHSASAGVKDSSLSPTPKIMLHLDNGWDWEQQEWWYDLILAQGPFTASDYDVQGVSYYPFYNPEATLAVLESSMSNMLAKYRKEVWVVETDWPSSCSNPKYAFPADAQHIPLSPAGQAQWIREVANVVDATGANGLFYWEPAWINNAGLGSSCEWNVLFDDTGKSMGYVSIFGDI